MQRVFVHRLNFVVTILFRLDHNDGIVTNILANTFVSDDKYGKKINVLSGFFLQKLNLNSEDNKDFYTPGNVSAG